MIRSLIVLARSVGHYFGLVPIQWIIDRLKARRYQAKRVQMESKPVLIDREEAAKVADQLNDWPRSGAAMQIANEIRCLPPYTAAKPQDAWPDRCFERGGPSNLYCDLPKGHLEFSSPHFASTHNFSWALSTLPAAAQPVGSWWCCDADYPNHAPTCKNAQPAPTTEARERARQIVENWKDEWSLESDMSSWYSKVQDSLIDRIAAALSSTPSEPRVEFHACDYTYTDDGKCIICGLPEPPEQKGE